MILPALLLASAVQPVYRFGAFIEATHAEREVAAEAAYRAATDAPEKSTDEPIRERSWPVELVALYPAGIGAVEQAFRAPAGGRHTLEADCGSSGFCPPVAPTAYRSGRSVRAEPSAAALIRVVAHPIHNHAPPPKL